MKQIDLLKRIIAKPGVYSCPEQREAAKKRLWKKIQRRDNKLIKRTQTKLEI